MPKAAEIDNARTHHGIHSPLDDKPPYPAALQSQHVLWHLPYKVEQDIAGCRVVCAVDEGRVQPGTTGHFPA